MANPSSLWDDHADVYERVFAPMTDTLCDGLFRLVSEYLDAPVAFLDIACGCGGLALRLAEWAKENGGRVVATDLAPRMVEKTTVAADSRGLRTHLSAEVQDGQALGFADDTFDAVFSGFGIFLFPERSVGWSEAARVLRSGGVFGTTVWRGPEHNPMARAQMEPLLRALPPRLLQPPARSWLEIATAQALEEEVGRACDWAWMQTHALHASIVLPSPQVAWKAMLDNPMTGALLRQCTPPELATVEASVLESFTLLAGGEDRPFPLHATCHALVARKR